MTHTTPKSTLDAGVIGVGSMGRHHVRIYDELPRVSLVGIADADPERANEVAAKYETQTHSIDDLLAAVDVVSVAVPTPYHFDVARNALARGVHTLVEKPFVSKLEEGRRLAALAEERGLVLQVGHVERFNPAIRTMTDIVAEYDLVAVDARRLGPPLDRDVGDGVVLDLMIHDLDVLLSVADGDPDRIRAMGARDNQYVTAQLAFDSGVLATLTASRVSQRRVRELELTTTECQIVVNYLDQSVRIHRRSLPEYVETNGGIRYRNESVVEYPTVDNGEPLRAELESFVAAVVDGRAPEVSADEALSALELALRIDDQASRDTVTVNSV